MIRRNRHFARLSPHYFFQEVGLKCREFSARNPTAELISLGIGDTTEPIPSTIVEALKNAAHRLGERTSYLGYGPEQGMHALRQKISEVVYQGRVAPDEIFISDGAKCDLGRLQLLFGEGLRIAVQDPTYPMYVDGSLALGAKEIIPMPCSHENAFFPDLNRLPEVDILYFCSPNNPTGAVATKEQLIELIAYAKAKKVLIIFDAAYAAFIRDATLPHSIYEIEGAHEVAIEVSSFSKLVGFTGVRLGWTVVPHPLQYADGHSIHKDWNRLLTTLFNGASCISQAGGLATLESLEESQRIIQYYLSNGAILKQALLELGFQVFGGDHAPYLWARYNQRSSWEMFHHFLEKYHVIVTPGCGFGAQGEGYVRMTTFNSRDNILNVQNRLLNNAQIIMR